MSEVAEKLASKMHTLSNGSSVTPTKKEPSLQPPARPILTPRPPPVVLNRPQPREESVLDVVVAKNRESEEAEERAQKRRLKVLVEQINQRAEKERRKKEKKEKAKKEMEKKKGGSNVNEAVASVKEPAKESVKESMKDTVAPVKEPVKESLKETMASVKESVREIVAPVKESVKEPVPASKSMKQKTDRKSEGKAKSTEPKSKPTSAPNSESKPIPVPESKPEPELEPEPTTAPVTTPPPESQPELSQPISSNANPSPTDSTSIAQPSSEKDTMSPLVVAPSILSVLEDSSTHVQLAASHSNNDTPTSKEKRLFDTDRSSLGEGTSEIFSSIAPMASRPPTTGTGRSISDRKNSRSSTPARNNQVKETTRKNRTNLSVDAAAYIHPEPSVCGSVQSSQGVNDSINGEDESHSLRLDQDLFVPQYEGMLDSMMSNANYSQRIGWPMYSRYPNASQSSYLCDSTGYSYPFADPYLQSNPRGYHDGFSRSLYTEYDTFLDYRAPIAHRGTRPSLSSSSYRDPLMTGATSRMDLWDDNTRLNESRGFLDRDDILADDYEDTPLNLRDPDSLIFPGSRSSSVNLYNPVPSVSRFGRT